MYGSPANAEKTLLKDLTLQSSPPSSPLRSRNCIALQPWTTAGTRPLDFILAKLSAPTVMKGLQMEVDKLSEHTSDEAIILVEDFGAQFLDAYEFLQEKKVLDLQGC
jgi:hypothetical protein